MRRIAAVLLILCGVVACDTSKTISLTAEEKKTAMGFVEKRRDLQARRAQVNLEYQKKVNEFATEEQQINNDFDLFSFALRKSHSIAFDERYRVNEFKGVIEKQ